MWLCSAMKAMILVDEVVAGAELAAAQQPAGEDGEEQLDLVEPAGVAGGVVDHEAGVVVQPGFGLLAMWLPPLSITRWTASPRWVGGVDLFEEGDEVVGVVAGASVASTSPVCTSRAAIKQAVP